MSTPSLRRVSTPPGPAVTSIADHPDPEVALATYHRVDAAAFGTRPSAAQVAAKRPMVEPRRWFLASLDGEPCGGAGSFRTELTLPGGRTVPAAAVSDVGVVPTHRRRGVAAALMARQLDTATEDGDAVAVLHASDAGIYERFGYGIATRWRQIRIDARRVAFRDDRPTTDGTTRLVTREEAADCCPRVHDAVRRVTAGGLARSSDWWNVILGDSGAYLGGHPEQLVMVHEDGGGVPDGYVIYRVHQDWSGGQAAHTLAVWELVGTSPAVELDLWATLTTHDLLDAVTGPIRVDHELRDAVIDARQVGVVWDQDLLWLRLLDVERVLTGRAAGSEDRVVIEVVDGFRPHTGGRFVVEGDAGRVRCIRTDGAVEARLDISELGSLALGGGSARALARAGRIGLLRPDVATRLDRLLTVDPQPWCWVRF